MTVKLSNINFTHINQRKGIKSKNLSQYFQIALKAKSNDESTEQISLYLCVFSIRSAVGKKDYIFICFDKKYSYRYYTTKRCVLNIFKIRSA